MKRRYAAFLVFFCGFTILCVALFGIYKDFFAPRLGPLGTGEYAWITYAIYTSAFIGGLCYSVLGVIMYVKTKRVVE